MTGTNWDWEDRAEQYAAEALAAGSPTAWFDRTYAAGRRGEVSVPWDKDEANPLLVEWAASRDAAGRSALVVGCGLGKDSEFVGSRGYTTTAFDVSETAVTFVRERYPDSPVHYTVADLFDPPAEWSGAFDLVVEINTVQALPVPIRERAVAQVGGFVAPGGTLLAIYGAVRVDGEPIRVAPPWPLTRAEVESFATNGLTEVSVERVGDRWQAEFRR